MVHVPTVAVAHHMMQIYVFLNHQDTLFDHLVLDPGQLLHHDVNETGDEAGQKANQTADHPTTDLQTTKTLKTPNRVKTREINKNKKEHRSRVHHRLAVLFFPQLL